MTERPPEQAEELADALRRGTRHARELANGGARRGVAGGDDDA
jgi:hypothetical protein